MTNCHALTMQDRVCKNTSKFGVLCGLHYAIAEEDISRVEVIDSDRLASLVKVMDQFGIPLDMEWLRVKRVLHDGKVYARNDMIRQAVAYRHFSMCPF